MTRPCNITYTIDEDANIVFKQHHGNVTVDDEKQILTQLFVDPEFVVGMDIVCDVSDSKIDWSLKDMDEFRNFLGSYNEQTSKSRWAIIAPGGITNHNARLFIKLNESLGGHATMQLFEKIEDALSWLAETSQPVVQSAKKCSL